MKLRTVVRRATRRKVRKGWRKVAARPLFSCGACGKSYSNPLGHVCSGGGDFGKRRRAQQRAAAAAEREQKRAAERQRVSARVAAARKAERAKADARIAKAKAARKPPRRPGRPLHDYARCRDHDCQRQACEAYREGVADTQDAQERAR